MTCMSSQVLEKLLILRDISEPPEKNSDGPAVGPICCTLCMCLLNDSELKSIFCLTFIKPRKMDSIYT